MKLRLSLILIIILVLIGILVVRRSQQKEGVTSKEDLPLVVTTTAKQQDLLITVTQTGGVIAKNSIPVVPEIPGRIQWVCENGIIVNSGDIILQLDPTQSQDAIDDLLELYDESLRRQAESETAGSARMKEMRLRLKKAKDDVKAFEEQKKLTLKQSENEITFNESELAERRKDLKAKETLFEKGIISGAEIEREKATLRSAEFALEKSKSDYELMKSQVAAQISERRRAENNTTRDMSRTRGWSERGMRMTGNQVENLDLQLKRAREDLLKNTIKAPTDGLVVLVQQGGWRGNSRMPRISDWVAQGREVASIVSLDELQVQLEMDQAQITDINMNQTGEIVIEAMPGEVLKGKITSIGQTARKSPIQGWMGSSSTATFPVIMDLPPIGASLIRPGMRASVRIVSKQIEDVIVVPIGCVFDYKGKKVVYVERKDKFERVYVETGESNSEYMIIEKGLKTGDKVALNNLGASSLDESSKEETRDSSQ